MPGLQSVPIPNELGLLAASFHSVSKHGLPFMRVLSKDMPRGSFRASDCGVHTVRTAVRTAYPIMPMPGVQDPQAMATRYTELKSAIICCF